MRRQKGKQWQAVRRSRNPAERLQIGPDVYLPEDVYCASGTTIELYNRQICLQAEQYYVKWNCRVGKALKRKFSVTGTDALLGHYPLTFEIYDAGLVRLCIKEATLHIVKNTLGQNYNILPIGDSLTNNKPWEPEVMRLSCGRISFVGTRGPYCAPDSQGDMRRCCHEGRSGVSARWYTCDNRYTFETRYVGNPEIEEAGNPFFNPETKQFSLSHYIRTQGSYLENMPDLVLLYLGTNGISLDNEDNADCIKILIDSLRADMPEMPIYVVNTLYRGNQNGIGIQQNSDGYASQAGLFQYQEDKKVMNLQIKLSEMLRGYERLYFIPVAATHDSEFNFGAKEVPVNPRAVQKEYLPVESVHPQAQGYYQMADCVWSVLAGTLI